VLYWHLCSFLSKFVSISSSLLLRNLQSDLLLSKDVSESLQKDKPTLQAKKSGDVYRTSVKVHRKWARHRFICDLSSTFRQNMLPAFSGPIDLREDRDWKSSLKVEVTCSFETSVSTRRSTRCINTEEYHVKNMHTTMTLSPGVYNFFSQIA
jgi:hypothetical protein